MPHEFDNAIAIKTKSILAVACNENIIGCELSCYYKYKQKRESLERNSLKILELEVAKSGKLPPIPIFILFESGLSADFRWLKTVRIGLKRAVSVENYDFLDW